MEYLDYIELVGERIQEWIESDLTFNNGCKRLLEEGDGFEEGEVSWMFTQKGQGRYLDYVRRAQRLVELKYPNIDYEDLERYTGVIYA